MPTVTGSAALTGTGTANLSIYSSWYDRPYIIIDGIDITDHGRSAQVKVSQSQVKHLNTATGFVRNFYPRNFDKMSVNLSWKNLPDTSAHTSDGREGRLFLKSLASKRRTVLLYLKKTDQTGYTKLSTFVSQYNEALIMRRNEAGGVLYDVQMQFTEL